MGKPTHEPTEDDRFAVMRMCANGVPHERIAKMLGITRPTLRKHYKRELEFGKDMIEDKISSKLLKRGLDDDCVTSLIFYAKCRLKWNDRPALEQNDKPQRLEIQVIPKGKDFEGDE